MSAGSSGTGGLELGKRSCGALRYSALVNRRSGEEPMVTMSVLGPGESPASGLSVVRGADASSSSFGAPDAPGEHATWEQAKKSVAVVRADQRARTMKAIFRFYPHRPIGRNAVTRERPTRRSECRRFGCQRRLIGVE